VLLKGCSIVGVFWGEFARRERDLNAANLRELTTWLRAKKIKPLVSANYPLERAADALKDMMNRKVQGKVVLTTD
jgi:NADPH2:quinone reductase